MHHWSTASFAPAARFEAWADALNTSHLSWALDAPEVGSKKAYVAQVATREDGDFSLVHCACDPCAGTRDAREIGQYDDGYYGILALRSGHEEVSQPGFSARLGPGDMLVWDASRPCRFRAPTPIRKTTLFVSRARLRALSGSDALTPGVIDTSGGWGALLRDRVLALRSVAAGLDGPAFSRLAASLIGEVAELARPVREAGLPPRAALLARIDKVMEARLADPDLGPSDLAARVGISQSYLFHLFRDAPDTVAARILRKRLDGAAAALEDPRFSGHSITEIAFAHGFSSAAHFSRRFKARFGVSPRDFRQKHKD
ncbi:MAG: helix-turn-helix domain-containing protein [Pseudomonadota bacterium]